MGLESRYLSLLFCLCSLLFSFGAIPEMALGENSFTESWNFTHNASESYLDLNLSSGCSISEKFSNTGIKISADEVIEKITFLNNSTESEASLVLTPGGSDIMYTVKREGSVNFEAYRMRRNGSGKENLAIEKESSFIFNDINPNGTELILTKSKVGESDAQNGLYAAILENKTIIPYRWTWNI